MTFAGDGAIADFRGVYTTTEVGRVERPLFAADSPLGFGTDAPSGNATFSATIRNAVPGANYTAFAADSPAGPWAAERDSVAAGESGTLVLTVDATKPARFLRIVASPAGTSFRAGDPLPDGVDAP